MGAVVNLCDEFMGPAAEYRKHGISLLWLRTVDHLEPTVPAMRTAVAFIEHHRKRGAGVYIHCKSGRGRSAAIAMAWLLQVKRLTPLQANLQLLQVRKVRAKLFLQKNVIQFFEELPPPNSANNANNAEQGQAQRSLSFATWAPNDRRNSTTAQRDVLRGDVGAGGPAGPGGGEPPLGGGGGGRVGQFMRGMSFRAGAAAKDILRRGPSGGIGGIGGGGGGGGLGSLPERASMAHNYGYDVAPPNWDAPPTNGFFEIPVAPSAPAIPEHLPPWAQHERQQYEQQQQPAGRLGGGWGALAQRPFQPAPAPYQPAFGGGPLPPTPPAPPVRQGTFNDDGSRRPVFLNTSL